MSNRSSSHSANRVTTLHEGGVEGQAIWQRLVEQHDFAGRYSSLKRFVRRLDPGAPRATLRLEVDPGTEAPVEGSPARCSIPSAIGSGGRGCS